LTCNTIASSEQDTGQTIGVSVDLPLADPLEFTLRWPVRGYELDSRGHVNNAVYLNWAEELATAHAEAAGYGQDWSARRGGGWVIRRTEITYHRPAVYGDEVELTVKVELVRGARGVRRTTIRRVSDGGLLAEVLTEWVWVRLSDGRPMPAPRELVELAAAVTKATIARRRGRA
jgi:acyl-CoA thioester hydrolase